MGKCLKRLGCVWRVLEGVWRVWRGLGLFYRTGSRGGPGGQDPPFCGTSKLYIEGKNVVCVCANGPHFST